MSDTCGCCEGIEQLTPQATANRPGLRALSYRVGTHATFLETMKARLSSLYLDVPREDLDAQGHQVFDRIYPLRNLRTRAADDPAIALLDAWATLGAVLTFYQERIANEGYLMTATERRSILELARLIGYELRPGVSASVFLAYTIDDKTTAPVIIPAGAKSQSVPGPGEQPQTFETSEPLEARAAWNNLKPRPARPSTPATIQKGMHVYLTGITTNLKAGDPLLIDFGDAKPILYRVTNVQTDATLDRTLVQFQDWLAAPTLAGMNVRAQIATLVSALRNTATLKKTTLKSEIMQRIQAHADDLEKRASAAATDAQLVPFYRKALTSLNAELGTAASDVKYKLVAEWLSPIVTEARAALVPPQTMMAAVGDTTKGASVIPAQTQTEGVAGVISKLALPASVPPRSTNFLTRAPDAVFAANADIGNQAVTTLLPALRGTFSTALSGGKATGDNQIHVYALRAKAAPFGNTAPLKITNIEVGKPPQMDEWTASDMSDADERENVIYLDASYDKILPNSWLVIDTSAVDPALLSSIAKVQDRIIARAQNPNAQLSRAAYGISGKTTRVELVDPAGNTQDWFKYIQIGLQIFEAGANSKPNDFQIIRRTAVFAQSEELTLADEPMPFEICDGASDWIELDEWYADLKSGRWAIVSGERSDIRDAFGKPVSGIKATELVMLAEVIQDISTNGGEPSSQRTDDKSDTLPNEQTHTFVRFAKALAYCYQRDTVTIYGNVVKATNGETRKEVLGSGDGSQALQSFTLRQPPLTYVAAPNPRGVDSTLQVYVNDVRWHETDSLAALAPTDREFITRTNDDAQTTIILGNGEHGARLPTGRENIRATYRNGIGKAGNVNAEQISLLMTRPNGVKDVINPLRASGGADKESRDQARENAPLAVMALDRLVSTQDYADFARTFAGIGKAAAARLPYGGQEIVHVTIAGADDIPIELSSDLYRNLVLALRQYGDPFQPFRVALRELLLIVISANVRMDADYQWDKVAVNIRNTLLDTFSFAKRALGQDVVLSQIISAMQSVPGVVYVDVDRLRGIPEMTTAPDGTRQPATPEQILDAANGPLLDANENPIAEPLDRLVVNMAHPENGALVPAQLAILSPNLPDTLLLNQIA